MKTMAGMPDALPRELTEKLTEELTGELTGTMPERRRAAMQSYRLTAKVLHWVTAALVLAMIACGVIAKQLGEGPVADTLMNMHKLTGVITFAIVVVRLGYRLGSAMPQWALRARRRPLLHSSLYAVVLLVPLLGWAGISDFGAREVAFGIVLPPIWPEGAGYDELLLRLHAYAAFALLALVAFHIGMAIQDTMTAGRPEAPGE
jgi:cytochrome b561